MPNSSSLDTNIILRVILNDSPRLYRKAEKLLSDESQEFLVDDLAITESVYVMESQYRLSREEIVEKLSAFLATDNIISSNRLSSVFPLYLKHPKLSFNDIYLSVKSEEKSAEPLWTFDKKLSAQLPSPKYLA